MAGARGGGLFTRSPYKELSGGALRDNLDAADDEAGEFALPLRQAAPSMTAGAPTSREESRETLARLKRMAGFESQDFDPADDNDVEREFRAHRTEADYGAEECWRWVLACLIGVAMGALSFAVDWGIDKLNDARYLRVLRAAAAGAGFWRPYFVFAGMAAAFATVAGALVSFVEPLAAGSGIAEVKTYLNGVHIRGLLTVRTLLAKLAGVVFSIGAGLVAGKEGPFVHGGGIVGGGIGSMGSQTLTRWLGGLSGRGRGGRGGGGIRVAAPRRFGGYFRSDADHRDFVAVGTAAGVATAFAAPIGGLLFTIEEGASFYSTSIFWRGFLATGSGVLTLHALVELHDHGAARAAAAHFGRYRDFGLYADSLAFYGSRMFYYFWDVPIFCLMGVAGGVGGAAFVAANVRVTAWRARVVPAAARWRRLAEVVALSVATATLFYLGAYFSPCLPLPAADDLRFLEASEDADDAFYAGGGAEGVNLGGGGGGDGGSSSSSSSLYAPTTHFPRLWCPVGHYSSAGQLALTPLSQALRLVVHLGEPLPEARQDAFSLHAPSLLFFSLACLGCMCVTNGVGASTGMFVPALAVGAAGGRLTGQLVRWFLRHALGIRLPVSLAAYAVVGAAAFMGGATRMTLTTTVMVMETTGALQLIVPLIVAVFCAKVTGDALGVDGIDDTHLKLRGAPVLDEPALTARQKMVADKLTVGELAAAPVVALPPVVEAGRLLEVLASCNHSAFPVTPDAGGSGGGGGGGGLQQRYANGIGGGGGGSSNDGGGDGNDATAAAATPSSPSSSSIEDCVVAGPFSAHGLIRRDVALKLLEHRLGFVGGGNGSGGNGNGNGSIFGGGGASAAATAASTSSPSSSSLVPRTQQGREAVLCLLEQRPIKSRRDELLAAAASAVRSRGDERALVDLRPFMQRNPHVVAADASLSRAYRLFRTLGLRHLLVAPSRPQAVGLITRKDICEANARLALGRKANAGLATASARLTRAGLPFIPYSPYDPTVGGGGGGFGVGGVGNGTGGSSLGTQRLSSGGLVGGGGGGGGRDGSGGGGVGSLSFAAAAAASQQQLGLEAVDIVAGGGPPSPRGASAGLAETRRRGGGGGSGSPASSSSLAAGGSGGGSDAALASSASAAAVEMATLLPGGGGGSGGGGGGNSNSSSNNNNSQNV